METTMKSTIAVLPAADVQASLQWWVERCGFVEMFCHGTPLMYAGIGRGGAQLHLSLMDDAVLARTVGDQTMVRIVVEDVTAFYKEFQERGGTVHPNGALQKKPWGTLEFGAIDPNGVCVAFVDG